MVSVSVAQRGSVAAGGASLLRSSMRGAAQSALVLLLVVAFVSTVQNARGNVPSSSSSFFPCLLYSGSAESVATTTTTTTTTSKPQNQIPPSQLRASRSSDSIEKSTWPGVPVEAIGHELVRKGVSFVDDARKLFLEHLEEFLDVYEARPDKVNLCGIRINHAYALFLAVKALQPTSIIESGVNAGQSTYFMRAAAPDAHIYAIDPLEKPICGQEKRWIDPKTPGKSTYYTGPTHFQDFGAIDWGSKIKSGEIDPRRTLVFLDDHRRVFDRWNDVMRHGFRHVLLEDNYKIKEGATADDKAGWTPKQMLARVDHDSEFLWHSLESYAEFPPLVSPVLSAGRGDGPSTARKPAGGFLHHRDSNHDIVMPLLRPELDPRGEDAALFEKICRRLGLDPKMLDNDSYMQVLNYNQFSYLQVRPASPYLLSLLMRNR